MRFVLECVVCKRVINEFIDDSYMKMSAHKSLSKCEKCCKNLQKLGVKE